MSKSPPAFARRLLLSFLREDLAEEVLGDLGEKFHSMLKKRSPFTARLNYWYQVFNYLRPFAIKKTRSVNLNHFQCLKTTSRSPGAINVFGFELLKGEKSQALTSP